MEDLDQRAAESRDLETILDAPDESYRIDLGTDVFKEAANEYWRAAC